MSIIINILVYAMTVFLGLEVFRKKNNSRRISAMQGILILLLPLLPLINFFWLLFAVWFVCLKDKQWYKDLIQKIKDLT